MAEAKRMRRRRKVNVPAHDGPGASSLGDDSSEALSIELDEQCKQAQERDGIKQEPEKKAFATGYRCGLADAEADRQIDASKVKDVMPGTLIRVTFGVEKFSPIQYHTFDVGGAFIDVHVREGESAIEAWRRGYKILEQMVAEEFKGKLVGFTKRLQAAGEFVRNAARS